MRRYLLALIVGALTFILAGPARADTLEDVKKSGKLVWGADQEGGGPYVYPRDDNPEEITGYEVELAEKLATYLQVKPEFYQGNWDKLLDLLNARKFDIVMNGYEWSPERADGFEASIPYYVYALQLLVRKDDVSLKAWDDLKKPLPDGSLRKIGVLTGSAADDHMVEFCGEACEVVHYDGVTDAMREVETGKLDATLQDTPIASFYGPRFPALHYLGDAVAPGYYIIFARKGETGLIKAINEALILMIRNGDLEAIYRKYGMWNKDQDELFQLVERSKFFGYLKAMNVEIKRGEAVTSEEVEQVTTRKHGMEVVQAYFPTLAGAAWVTVKLSAISFPLAVLAGILIAVGRLYGPGWVRVPLATYVEFLRGTPLMLQLYFIFFFLPEVGINIPAFAAAILGLAINYSAYESEIYRAGIQAIPPGQMEAALSLGMSRTQAIFRIVVPQAFRIVIPPVVNDFIALFKDTSVCSVVTVIELTKRFSVLAMSTQAIVEMMMMTAFLYLLMSYPMSLIAQRIEKRLGTGVSL